MTRYHIKSALKYVLKFRSHTVFSLVGLVIALACVFIISAWTIQELRYDRFHRQADHIFMLTTDIKDDAGNMTRFPETPPPLAAAMEEQIPQIESGFRFLYLYGKRSLGIEEISFKEAGIAACPKFLEVFNFPLLAGNASELADPNSIFLSRRLANKIFPGEMAVGKEVLYRDKQVLLVKGIFKDVPRNSSLQFDFLIPYEIEYGISEEWGQLSDASFIKTSPSADMGQVQELMNIVWRENITDEQYVLGAIPITDLRYGADFEFFRAEHGHGSRSKLYMFMGVALLILILACLNYINLISANAIKREYETWLRKVHGASSGDITSYLLVESVLLSFVAWGLATLLALLGLRVFENLMGIVISPSYFRICIGFGLLIAIIIVGLATGFYPAIKAGSGVLTNSGESRKPDFMFQRNLRNALVMSQFVLSIGLIVSSLIMIRQAEFMMDFETGYTRQEIVEFSLPGNTDSVNYELNNFLDAMPNIEGYTFAGASPVNLSFLNTLEKWKWEGLPEDAHTSFYHISVDEAYLDAFQIPLLKGRFFSSSRSDQNKIVINEKLATTLGFDDPLGQILRRGEKEYEIIGVVRNFNFQHLSSEIRPFLFTYAGMNRHLFVKIRSGSAVTLGQIQDQISALWDKPINYSMVEGEYDRMYSGEQQIISAILFFTILSILLSILGLIGVVAHGNEARTKEIAVRKVYGAESGDMMLALNISIIKIFIPGMLLGSLLAWLVMRQWLMNYVYRRGFEGWIFLVGALIILLVALLSVSIQTWRAANQSPIATLKNL